jgi:hypothetical protein
LRFQEHCRDDAGLHDGREAEEWPTAYTTMQHTPTNHNALLIDDFDVDEDYIPF